MLPFWKGDKEEKVASTGIEPVSGASETLILSIVLRGHKELSNLISGGFGNS